MKEFIICIPQTFPKSLSKRDIYYINDFFENLYKQKNSFLSDTFAVRTTYGYHYKITFHRIRNIFFVDEFNYINEIDFKEAQGERTVMLENVFPLN